MLDAIFINCSITLPSEEKRMMGRDWRLEIRA